MRAPLPTDEQARLATLHAMNVLDTPPEERFDRITRLATRLFDVPIAVVTLVDSNRVWFKSVCGLPIRETPRDVSFCPHAILADDTYMVSDTREEPCFADNPFVIDPPHLYFYGGHPLRAPNGHKVGIFCLLDTRPRRFSDDDIAILRDLAAIVEGELNGTVLSASLVARVEELECALEQLHQSDRHKNEFLSVISHELRTPLNFITGFASTLEDEVQGPLNDAQRAAVGKILAGSERMLGLVSDLLDLARIQAGQLRLDRCPSEMRALVDEVLSSLAPLAAQRGLKLLNEAAEGDVVLADGARIAQVLTNLVGNAIKFTAEGEVRVSTRWRGKRLVVEVTDTGPGISAEDQSRIFARFQQLDMSATRPTTGTGLGLAISKAIVEAHAGAIGVHSEPGQGSTFWFSLPGAAAEQEVPPESPVSPPVPEDEAARLASLHSLGILDTPREARYDRVTRLAAGYFRVPMAVVSLVDAERQWFKSCVGVDAEETSRAVSFCAYAIHHDETMLVSDARRDPRFASNPSVVGAPYIRFYVGRPLHGPGGHLIGTLCLCDSQPRSFGSTDYAALDDFARLIEAEFAVDYRAAQAAWASPANLV